MKPEEEELVQHQRVETNQQQAEYNADVNVALDIAIHGDAYLPDLAWQVVSTVQATLVALGFSYKDIPGALHEAVRHNVTEA